MQSTLDQVLARNLADVGAVSLDDYIQGTQPILASEPVEGDPVARLHQACQRAFRCTHDPLRFEFVQGSATNKQCILTITKPDGVRRAYATQPIFADKNEAKLEAARIAIDMGALDFLQRGDHQTRHVRDLSVETSSADNAPSSDAMSLQSTTAPDSLVDDIEKCCLDWRAGRLTPHWVPFFDVKSPHKQGCALRIQLSTHVARIYISDSTFDTFLDAKWACAKAAASEGVLDFIMHGNGQTRPSPPTPSTSSASQSPPANPTTPWTLQAFYDSLPRPFREHFQSNDVTEINPLAWMNTMSQYARGGKLVVSFFFTSDGPPGLHGCILKLDRPEEYKAFLVDARFTKRSDAKAAVCLQAMSEGIGDYIRSIAFAVDNKVTSTMRSFSSSLAYPALTSGLSKVDTDLHLHFEYHKERDAFGATLLVRLSTLPISHQMRRYTVPSDYRSKADAKVAVICHAAEQGAIEFVRFRGGPGPHGYTSPYSLHTYDPEASRKRKHPASVEDMEQSQPARKKKKKGKRRAETGSQGDVRPVGQYLAVHPSGDQMHGISGPGDMGLSQSLLADGLCDPSQRGVGGAGGSGAARPVVYDHGVPFNTQSYASPYSAVMDPRFFGDSSLGSRGYGVQPAAFGGGSHPFRGIDAAAPPGSGPSFPATGTSSRTLPRPSEDAELEPGEVLSSAESEFSVGSSRNDDNDRVPVVERGTDIALAAYGPSPPVLAEIVPDNEERENDDVGNVAGRRTDKSKAKEVSHVQNLIEYCARHGCGTPSFHEVQSQGRYQVWIVIGREWFDLPTTYASAEEGRQRVAKQVLARSSKGSAG